MFAQGDDAPGRRSNPCEGSFSGEQSEFSFGGPELVACAGTGEIHQAEIHFVWVGALASDGFFVDGIDHERQKQSVCRQTRKTKGSGVVFGGGPGQGQQAAGLDGSIGERAVKGGEVFDFVCALFGNDSHGSGLGGAGTFHIQETRRIGNGARRSDFAGEHIQKGQVVGLPHIFLFVVGTGLLDGPSGVVIQKIKRERVTGRRGDEAFLVEFVGALGKVFSGDGGKSGKLVFAAEQAARIVGRLWTRFGNGQNEGLPIGRDAGLRGRLEDGNVRRGPKGLRSRNGGFGFQAVEGGGVGTRGFEVAHDDEHAIIGQKKKPAGVEGQVRQKLFALGFSGEFLGERVFYKRDKRRQWRRRRWNGRCGGLAFGTCAFWGGGRGRDGRGLRRRGLGCGGFGQKASTGREGHGAQRGEFQPIGVHVQKDGTAIGQGHRIVQIAFVGLDGEKRFGKRRGLRKTDSRGKKAGRTEGKKRTKERVSFCHG